MKQSFISRILWAGVFLLFVVNVCAQQVIMDRNEGRGYKSLSDHSTTSFSSLQTSGSAWSEATTPLNYVLTTGNWPEALKRQTYQGQSTEHVDWVTYTFNTPSYSRIEYKIGYWVESYSDGATPLRFTYLDYGDDVNNYWKNRNAAPNGQNFIYTATGADGNVQAGEHSAFKTSSTKSSTTKYLPQYEFDNRTGQSTMTNYKYGVYVTSKGVGASSGTYTTRITTGYSVTAYYYKYVTFDANGGTGSMDGITVENEATLPSQTMSNNGKTFICWNTKPDGSGTSYFDRGVIEATANDKGPVTLYAIWDTPYNIPVTIGYFTKTSVFNIPVNVTKAGDYILRFRTAYGANKFNTFGWSDFYFDAKISVTNAGGTTILCDGNNTDIIRTYATHGDWSWYNNSHAIVLKNLPVGESVISISWSDLHSSSNQYAHNFNYFRIEELEKHTIQFNSNGGSGSMSAVNNYIEGTALPQNSFTKANCTFAGWALTPEGDVVATNNGILHQEHLTGTSQITLYAIWRETNRLFIANGITGPSEIENHEVIWDSEEHAAYFNGSSNTSPDHYLKIQGKPLNGASLNSGFTIEFDAYLFNDSRAWGRMFDIGKDRYNYFFLNGGNTAYLPEKKKGFIQCAYGYSTNNTLNESIDCHAMHDMQTMGSNQILNHWRHYKYICAPGGYTTVFVDNIPVAWKSVDQLLINTLSQMDEFVNYYIGISSVDPGNDHSPHMYMRNLYFSPQAEGGIWDGTKFMYRLSYSSDGGDEFSSITTDKLPETLPTPSKSGKVFKGWYTNAELTVAAVPGATLLSPTTLYAKWVDDHSTDTEGGVNYTEGVTVTPEDVAEMLKEPGTTPAVDLSLATVAATDVPAIVSSIRNSAKGENAFIILPAGTYDIPAVDNVNIIIGDKCENLNLVDRTPMQSSVLNRNFTAKVATYVRTQGNEWGTVCLPFQLISNPGIQYYTLKNVEGSTMTFVPVDHVEANTPVVFRRLNGNEINVSDTEADIFVTGSENENIDGLNWELIGTYKPIKISHLDNSLYYIAQNKFWQATQASQDVSIPAYRAYFETSSAVSVRSFSLVFCDEEETMVGTIDEEGNIEVTTIYGINGMKLKTSTKGVNIINGQKVIK